MSSLSRPKLLDLLGIKHHDPVELEDARFYYLHELS